MDGSQNDIEQLKAHKESIERTTDKDTPLDAIRQKELEIKGKLMEAQKAAEEDIAAARREAVQIKEQAKKNGLSEGKATYKKELEAARKQAEDIKANGFKDAEIVLEKGLGNLEKAVQKVIDMVVPGREDKGA